MRFAHILVSLHGAPAEKKGIWLESGKERRILKEMWKKNLRTTYTFFEEGFLLTRLIMYFARLRKSLCSQVLFLPQSTFLELHVWRKVRVMFLIYMLGVTGLLLFKSKQKRSFFMQASVSIWNNLSIIHKNVKCWQCFATP